MTENNEDYRGFTITPIEAPDGSGVNHYLVRAGWDHRVWFPANSIIEARRLIFEWWSDASLEPGDTRRVR